MTYFLDLRARDSGGVPADQVTVAEVSLNAPPAPPYSYKVVPAAQIAAQVTGRDVLIATHGFNVNRLAGIERLSNWENLLSLNATGFYVGVLWPGDSRWVPAVDYPIEGEEAIKSGKLLAPFLNQNFANVGSLSFVSHSLGARVVLETIRWLDVKVKRVVLMAGAIDNDCLIKEYKDVTTKIDKISVLASKKDEVLSMAFPIGNLFEGLITPTHPFFRGALGHSGPRTPYPTQLRMNWQIPDSWKYGHGNYLPGGAVNPLIVVPQDLPTQVQQPPAPGWPNDWRPAWSACFVSTRLP